MDAQGRTKQSLLDEAKDIEQAWNDEVDRRAYRSAPLEQRIGQLEIWVKALMEARADDLRERAALMPDAPASPPKQDT